MIGRRRIKESLLMSFANSIELSKVNDVGVPLFDKSDEIVKM